MRNIEYVLITMGPLETKWEIQGNKVFLIIGSINGSLFVINESIWVTMGTFGYKWVLLVTNESLWFPMCMKDILVPLIPPSNNICI